MTVIGRERRTLAVEHLETGVAVLRFFVPDHSQNVLTAEVLADLAAVLESIDAGPEPTGLVIASAREGSFFAGADMSRVAALKTLAAHEIQRLCAAGRSLFGRLSSRPWPSVAVIDGVCLGGGLELALACDLRVATDSPHTRLGFPEVKLGLLPGWGGTVRLPRLIGTGPAVEFTAAGEPVDGATAARLGLVDACVSPEQALRSACSLIESARTTQSHIDRRRVQAAAIAIDPDERAFLEATTAAVMMGRTGGHYPAPAAILKTILSGAAVPAAEAAVIEGRAFADLARSPVSAQLVRLFQIGERNRHDPGLDDAGDIEPREIAKPAVIGAGIMGAGIAARQLRSGFTVTLVDVQPEAISASVGGILDEAAWDRDTKRIDPSRAVALAGRLRTATSLAAIASADLVIESVVERTDIKRQVLADIERAVGSDTVIATNTSTNPIAKLAEVLTDPTRFCGIHFFNPVRRMMLVEVIRGPATSDATVATAVAHAKRLGKCPVVVQDSPGFLVNRILMPYLHEAVELLREGVPMHRIDRAARAFGMPMGPIELYDMIGLDTAFYAGLVMAAAFGDRIDASPVIPALVKSGRLGRKTGGGFYRYKVPADGNAQRARIDRPDEGVPAILASYALPDTQPTAATITDRLVIPMLLEAVRAVDEGIVRDGRDIDLAVIHALGFPAFRGGLLAWADSLGAAEIVRRLKPLATLGPRMTPPDRLLALARTGGRFTTDL
jgi:3-hydroxyacyl-CoA dehydrogenase/enoyl-CoA hydratase/3-hydroxybutyryl-CoA epimerase/3-hydroxyacyl-CoA dehydrogenase/enoyl-CoA hydratase/3-hydroxybutyryl-CoA epimerase/enoyl-CoA isomerase